MQSFFTDVNSKKAGPDFFLMNSIHQNRNASFSDFETNPHNLLYLITKNAYNLNDKQVFDIMVGNDEAKLIDINGFGLIG